MAAHIDHPLPGVPFEPSAFWILGWVYLEKQHAELLAIEAWHDETLLGESAATTLTERPDVSALFHLPSGTGTAFVIAAKHQACPVHPFELHLRARLRDGNRTAPLAASIVTPPSPEHDPAAALRARVSRESLGLEIGAHARPTAGLSPFYCDTVASYAGTSGRVDFLADAMALPLPDDTLDYLCSSHVLEHLPNPLAALHEWHRVLRPGGCLYLVVPDQRYTFDVGRPVTTVSHLLRDFLRDTRVADSAEHVHDFVYRTDWSRLQPTCPPAERPQRQAAMHASYLHALQHGDAIDIHFHTFTPDSLRELLRATGFLAGPRARFELLMQAERYPPDRIDGIAFLLCKRGSASRIRPRQSTYSLTHVDTLTPSLSLVCPISLEPIRAEPASGGVSALVAAHSNRRYVGQASLPSLLPPPDLPPRRPWSRRGWRFYQHLAATLRIIFAR